ncbi:hypothetical protein TEA_010605 [Camellia sinensis var. sinensis]|uniref:HNH domain-containing protein n=1 Tax=Camellia sinensis var. sinensis TaxID=542762 RepID=A0A4S4DF46_CAMSN|nr:hypothetical protein TEA_010605 [Camellia sinensis var. sinensis]
MVLLAGAKTAQKMRPNKGGGGGRRRRSYPSPSRDPPFNSSGFEPGPSGSRLSPSRASVLDRGLVTEEDFTVFDNLQIDPNPRSFPYSVKQQCWDKADKVKGRDPDRWRRDNLGNILFRKLVGCPGCLCHDYDHIVPYSKQGVVTDASFLFLRLNSWIAATPCWSTVCFTGISFIFCEIAGGKSTLENCQVLQVVTWIFWNCQHMAMSDEDKTLEDATFSDMLLFMAGNLHVVKL